MRLMNTLRAGARALRNSDYVTPQLKRQLLQEILASWEFVTKVVLIIMPILAEKGHATYDGAGFVLLGNFGDTPEKRAIKIIEEIPNNVISWFEDDIFSQKMGPLLFDQLNSPNISDIAKHELVLLLISQRPREWDKQVYRYITSIARNSFYLFDIYKALRTQYQYAFASTQTLLSIEHLIKMVAAKHLTGEKSPKEKTLKKVRLDDGAIPDRLVD
jgi:hypothetical protein